MNSHAERGALLGGVTGALAGGAIGSHNQQALPGAMIGAAVGGLTGAAIGDSVDDEIARNNAIIEQQMGRRLAGAATFDDVIAMTRANVGEEVIVTHVRANGVVQRPQAGDIILLKQQGVSDRVLQALQEATPADQMVAAPPRPRGPQPVIVEEHYHYDPWWGPGWCGPPPFHRHHRVSRGPGVHWGVTFGN